ncbi:hypothetical protein BBJ28_00022163 [Nothophytophthora sp. Chile5]|nr:hypothetical protein BBJ28_00022163 [Nothophytophthora sp. Chile5]
MTERHQRLASDSKFDDSNDEKLDDGGNSGEGGATEEKDDELVDDSRLSTASTLMELDRKDLLIVKDGTVRVAESLDREQQQLDANGEAVKASGTWTKAEHDRFLRAMETYPKGPWKSIAEMVATRTVRQTQTHAQKYREKVARRMRGLRNRNGTLQTPPMALGMGIAGYSSAVVSPYSGGLPHIHQQPPYPGAMAYTPMMAPLSGIPGQVMMTTPPTTMAATATATGEVVAAPMSSRHHPSQQPLPPRYASAALSSTEFSQLSQSSISSAFIGNTTYPPSWEANQAEGKEAVPDFDESMDFLMKMYSANPNQIGAAPLPSPPVAAAAALPSTTPSAAAVFPRTPRTPSPSSSSRARKRRAEQQQTQEPQRKHAKHIQQRDEVKKERESQDD